VEHLGESYEPSYVRRDAVRGGEELARSKLSIRLPRDTQIAQRFVAGPPSAIVEAEVFQRDDAATLLIWLGRIVNVAWSGSEAVAECEPISTSLRRRGLRARYQKHCRHALYDSGCTLDRNDSRIQAVLTGSTSLTLTAAEFDALPDGELTAGYVEHETGRRAIVGHVGDTITLGSPMLGAEVGDTVFAFSGCDHAFATCRDKFSNEENFGGFLHIPRRSPFGAEQVF
jgi:uncharacterized phage protein (TIGR02218 family)